MSATATARTRTSRNADAVIETPTGLKPVLDVIPEHCYERSTARGLLLFLRDVVIFGLAVWGLLSTNNPLLLIPLWALAGITVAGLFVIGHDASHGALLDSRRTNVYTIEKRGQKKLIYQAPWYQEGQYRGFIELSLELPAEMPHFIREP